MRLVGIGPGLLSYHIKVSTLHQNFVVVVRINGTIFMITKINKKLGLYLSILLFVLDRSQSTLCFHWFAS